MHEPAAKGDAGRFADGTDDHGFDDHGPGIVVEVGAAAPQSKHFGMPRIGDNLPINVGTPAAQNRRNRMMTARCGNHLGGGVGEPFRARHRVTAS